MKRTIAAFVIAFAALTTRPASADEPAPFPDRSHVAIVLDNLAGFVNANQSYPNSNPAQQDSGTNLFGWFPTTPVARFGVHGIFNGVTLGAGLICAHYDLGTGGLIGASTGTTELGLAPRIGYAFAVGPSTAIWVRGGFTYLHAGDSNDDGGFWQLSPGGELYLVYSPVPHFGLTIGPFAEFGVAGKQTSCTQSFGINGQTGSCTDQDIRQRLLGFTFGVLADF